MLKTRGSVKIKKILKQINRIFSVFGFNPKKFVKSICGLFFFFENFYQIKQQKGSDTDFKFGTFYPILDERNTQSGTMTGHYFHQDLFVARQIFLNNPKRHIDIGSRTDGFVAHVAVFREIEIIDIRNQPSKINNVTFKQADLMKLPHDLVESCDSLSSLHAIEHFGLGRYGDPIDYNGHLKAIENITKMLNKNGTFYFSVPIGNQRIEFNAHRVFSIEYLLSILKEHFILENFSYVNDKGDFFENILLNKQKIDQNCGCNLGCGIFILKKK